MKFDPKARWNCELDCRLIKQVSAFHWNRIAAAREPLAPVC
jgi:nuclear transport factor 2 (NTF2) superfamily protein